MLNTIQIEAASKYAATLVGNFGARTDESLAKQVADVHPVHIATAFEIVSEARKQAHI